VREVREEIGLDIEPLAKVWESPTDDGEWKLLWWTAEVSPGELRLDQQEVAEARWVTPEEFLHLEPTFEGDREFFERVLPTLDAPS
ncbi:MAG TPA: NUDIX domain-containing protein, partial [Actinomycetota bacterium]|nr:NUDIX domain-containing protein [Actinomycetota bacterium]